MKHILLTLMIFGIVSCSSEVVIECKLNGTKYVISKDESTLTRIYNGNQRIYQKESLHKNGIAQYRHDARDFITYDTNKKTIGGLLGSIGQCKQLQF